MSFYDEFNYDLLNNETKQSGGATVNKTFGWGKIGYPDDTKKNRRAYFKRKKKEEEKLIEEEIYDMKETMFLSELPKEEALQDSTIEAMLNRKVIFERDYDMRFASEKDLKEQTDRANKTVKVTKSKNVETYSVFKQNALTLKLSNALNDYDVLILVTEWKEFRSTDFDLMKLKMKGNLFIDGRNQFDSRFIESKGFKYLQIGVKE